MRKIFSLVFFFLFFSTSAFAITQEMQASLTPDQAINLLKSGNQRFQSGNVQHRDLISEAKATSQGQYPFAVILSCLDSRVPPEVIFDQGLGALFVARVAGNVINPDILGSMEFGTQLSGAKVIAVIGHTRCGAVRGSCQQAKLGNLTGLLEQIQPAIAATAKQTKKNCDDWAFVDEAAKNNVRMIMKEIPEKSPVIKKLLADKKIKLIGGMQDLATGQVTFFE